MKKSGLTPVSRGAWLGSGLGMEFMVVSISANGIFQVQLLTRLKPGSRGCTDSCIG
jgi:hypothetical protein